MSQPDPDRSPSRRLLSALADGDATDGEAARAFQAWRDDDDTRATWHAYQLIGDVLRSDDLAAEPAADERFLRALRARLADEPVVLAPPSAVEQQPAIAAIRPARSRWQGPLAMAAGFLAVIGGVNLMRGSTGHGNEPVVARAATAPASATTVATAAALPAPVPAPTAKVDADELAPYLAAHRQSTMNGAFQMPGGDFRNASLVQTAP